MKPGAAQAVAQEVAVGIVAPCRCFNGRRQPPLRVRALLAAAIAAALQDAGVPLTATLLEYRCAACEAVVPITLEQLLAANP